MSNDVAVDKMQKPLDHILREPLPWRHQRHTECGRLAEKVQKTIERDEYAHRLQRLGQRRTSFTVCQTCATRFDSAETWTNSPIAMLHRETTRVGPWSGVNQKLTEEQQRLTNELRALAALAEAHREEFDSYMAGLDSTISLAERRRELTRWVGVRR